MCIYYLHFAFAISIIQQRNEHGRKIVVSQNICKYTAVDLRNVLTCRSSFRSVDCTLWYDASLNVAKTGFD